MSKKEVNSALPTETKTFLEIEEWVMNPVEWRTDPCGGAYDVKLTDNRRGAKIWIQFDGKFVTGLQERVASLEKEQEKHDSEIRKAIHADWNRAGKQWHKDEEKLKENIKELEGQLATAKQEAEALGEQLTAVTEMNNSLANKLAKAREILNSDFIKFFEAMLKKMEQKRKEKGDTWKDAEAIYDIFYRYSSEPPSYKTMPMDKWLRKKLREEIKEYFADKNPAELIDVANCCAMLWSRGVLGSEKPDKEAP